MDVQQLKFVVPEPVIHTTVVDEAVILNLETGKYYGLDGVGERIWELLQHGCTMDDVVDQLVEEYDVTPLELSADVRSFVRELLDKGLLREVVT